MGSVSFKKLHGRAEVISMIRHCDAQERRIHNHANKDIDITRVNENLQSHDFESAIKRYEDRLLLLDSKEKANKRKDRVTCFGLEIPAPLELTETNVNSWYRDITNLIKRSCGGLNVISSYLHKDEIHDYYDHGEIKTSRPHIHIFVVPEVKGKLNGKVFSSRERMKKLNKEIHEFTKEVYHCDFMTGETPQKRTVEELKRLSEKELQAKEKELEILRTRTELLDSEKKKLQVKIESMYQDLQKLTDFNEMRELYRKTFDDELELEYEKVRSRGRSR